MAVGIFKIGQRLRLSGEAYRVSRDLGEGALVLEMLRSGSFLERSVADLLRDWRTGDLQFEGVSQRAEATAPVRTIYEDVFRQAYSQEAQAEAKAKLVYVKRLKDLPRTGSVMTPVINEIWSDKKLWKSAWQFSEPPHFTTVARWIRTYDGSSGDLRSLVTRHSDKGKGTERVAPEVCTMVGDAIELEYLTLERPSLKEIWRRLKGQVSLRNATRVPSEALSPPSYDYLKRRISELEPYDVCRARYGQRAADIKFRVAGQGVLTQHPLVRASMDHTKLDLFVVDEEAHLPLGRPWLTLILDENTRYVLGYYLGFEEPSSVSMTRALRHAIAPKELDPEVKNEWDAWGVMDCLIVDQALEFHSRILEGGASRYGITIEYCPRRKPWYKGKIERYFGTLNTGLLANLQGKTFSSVDLRGDYDPAKHAVITLQTLRRIVQVWIVDIYHQEVHRALGMSPQRAWEDGMRHGGGDSQPVDRYLPPSSIEIDSAFSASHKRRLTHKGIEYDSLFYNSAELGELRILWGAEVAVEVRVQDDDLGSIVVVSPDEHTLIKAPALDQQYAASLSRWQHTICKRFKRVSQEDDDREISLLDAKRRIRALIEQDMFTGGRKTRSRVKQQRFTESGKPANSEAQPEPPSAAAVPSPLPPPAESAGDQAATHVPKSGRSQVEQIPAIGEDEEIPAFKSSKRVA